MKLIFAIGNPGSSYKYTYHNLGLLLSDYLINKNVIWDKKETSQYVYLKLEKYNILQSKVFMNSSFDALRELYFFYKLVPENILVLHDDLSLKKYQFKLKYTEGLGGHNGLRDIAKNIGPKFPKLRIGIDHPKNFNANLVVADYVLSKIDVNAWKNFYDEGIKEINKWIES